jgi:acyl-coenzyme A synthetase/AMP-(fatty) acid ligase
MEAVPISERLAAQSTYGALRLGASVNPDAPAIHFLRTGEVDETPLTLSYRQFIGGVTQAANLFHELGIGPGDTTSFLLPLLPQSLFTLFGAECSACGASCPSSGPSCRWEAPATSGTGCIRSMRCCPSNRRTGW